MSESAFKSERDKFQFWLFAVITFLSSLSYSTLAYFSVILKNNGIPLEEIGKIHFIIVIPLLIATPISGKLVSKYGALKIAIIGMVITFISYISYQFTQYNPLYTYGTRIVQGFGTGLTFSASMIYAKQKLNINQSAYYLGIFASMIPLSFVFGPAIAEWYYKHFGNTLFFFVTSLPAFISLVIIFFLKAEKNRLPVDRKVKVSFSSLLKRFHSMVPFSFILVSGLIYGFIPSFMSLYLTKSKISVTYFFVSYSILLFSSRFILIKYLQKINKHFLIFTGLVFMSISYLIISLFISAGAALIGGVLFGFGYSLMYPILLSWSFIKIKPEEHAVNMSMFNLFFNIGIYVSPLIGGYLISQAGTGSLMKLLSYLGLSAAIILILISHLEGKILTSMKTLFLKFFYRESEAK